MIIWPGGPPNEEMPVKIRPIRSIFRLPALAAAFAMAACTYQPGYRDNPVARSFAWFSYVNADDLRSSCAAGSPARYRIIYNGKQDEQVRTYDLTATADGGADLVIQVSSAAPDLVGGVSLADPLAPWRGKIERRHIGADAFQAIRGALRESGFYAPPPEDTRVKSWSFFWLAAACEDGKFTYNAWAYPSARFEQVTLKAPLMAVDNTGIAFNPPRPDTYPEREERLERRFYELVITGEGTKGHFTPF